MAGNRGSRGRRGSPWPSGDIAAEPLSLYHQAAPAASALKHAAKPPRGARTASDIANQLDAMNIPYEARSKQA